MPSKSTIGCLAAIGVVAVIFLAAFLLSPIGRMLLASRRHMSVRETCRFALPDGIHELTHSRIGIHPMMAEYSRDITFIANGRRGNSTPLRLDTCGGYPINCYFTNASGVALLRLDDAVSEHLLDLINQKTYLITRVNDVPYVGELKDERSSAGWSMAKDDPSTLTVTVGDSAATPMNTLTKAAPETYIGRIDGKLGKLKFIPVSESAEIQIDHLWDR